MRPRSALAVLGTALALTLPGPGGARGGGTLAARTADDLHRVAWDQAYADWRTGHPEATCEPARSVSHVTRAEDEWCYRCRRREERRLSEWWFYAFDSRGAAACRLHQYRVRILDSPGSPDAVQRELEDAMGSRYGFRDSGRVIEFGSAFWQNLRLSQSRDRQIYLFVDAPPEDERSVVLLARSRPLLSALEEDDLLWKVGRVGRRAALARLARELAGELPHVASLLKGERADPEQIHAAIGEALRAVEAAPVEDRPAPMLAASLLADRWEPRRQASHHGEVFQDVHGLRYVWSHIGSAWVYQRDLLRQLWREHPESEWGEFAFVELLRAGWDTSGTCAAGSAQFPVVIERASDFLEQSPASRQRLAVRFALAQAYETWWSVSRAAGNDVYVGTDFRSGADAARRSAIALYREVLGETRDAALAAYVRRRLPRLELGVATHQRRYFCIYD